LLRPLFSGLPVVASAQVAAAKLLTYPAVEIVQEPTGDSVASAVLRLLGCEYPEVRAVTQKQARQVFDWFSTASKFEKLFASSLEAERSFK